jgi:hypothetical protein
LSTTTVLKSPPVAERAAAALRASPFDAGRWRAAAQQVGRR